MSQPFVDAMLPDGNRLHVVLEGIARGFSPVNIRKHTLRATRLADLVDLGSLSLQGAAFLEASVRAGLNILVAGATQAGKTTLVDFRIGTCPLRSAPPGTCAAPRRRPPTRRRPT